LLLITVAFACWYGTTMPERQEALEMELRLRFVQFVKDQLGQPYQWGGQAPGGWDCSGLVIAGLNQCGMMVPDMTTLGLCDFYGTHEVKEVSDVGQLVFYCGNPKHPQRVTHVMVVYSVWNPGQYILAGARGGSSDTTTVDIAWQRKAFVDLVAGTYWKSKQACIVDPFID
jgi:cell wall-associated NlpC family hydrolase